VCRVGLGLGFIFLRANKQNTASAAAPDMLGCKGVATGQLKMLPCVAAINFYHTNASHVRASWRIASYSENANFLSKKRLASGDLARPHRGLERPRETSLRPRQTWRAAARQGRRGVGTGLLGSDGRWQPAGSRSDGPPDPARRGSRCLRYPRP